MTAAKLQKTEDPNLYLDQESGLFIWRENIAGVPYWRSTKTDKIGLARQLVKQYRSEATGKPVERLRRKFSEAFDVVLTIQSAKAGKTAEGARTQDNHLRPWFAEHCEYLSTFEQAWAEVWARYKTDQEALTPGRKLTHDRRHLLMTLRMAREKGWLKREFKKRELQLLEASEPIGKLYEKDELARLIPEARKSPPFYLQFLMAVLMGMRKKEILHLAKAEVDPRRGTISIKGARVKTRKARTVPIHVQVLPLLRAQIAAHPDSLWVFPSREGAGAYDLSKPQGSNKTAWKAAARRAGVKGRFHDLRHTAISLMIEEGIPDLLISQITGASLKVIRLVYLHMNLDLTEKVRNLSCGKLVGLD